MREASLGPSSMRTLRSSTAACFVHLSHSCTLPSSTLAFSSLSFSRARACLHRYTNTQEAQRARPPRGQTCPWDSSPLSPCNLQIRTRVQVHTCARGRWLRMLTCRLLAAGAAGSRHNMQRSIHQRLRQHQDTQARSQRCEGEVREGREGRVRGREERAETSVELAH